jgi:SAM-dependent methyltransferase
MKWSEISPKGYDAFYARPECERENASIRAALLRVVQPHDTVYDFGCGTGLARRLLGSRPVLYWGIDKDPVFVGEGQEEDARLVAFFASPDVSVFLFSGEEIGPMAVRAAIKHSRGYVVVWYRKPYRAKGSWFYRKPLTFFLRYWVKSRLIYCILKENGARINRLCGEKGYWIAERS